MRTLVDIDDEALKRAAVVLGTSTKVDTVNESLRLVGEQALLPTQTKRFEELLDLLGARLAETDVRAEAWR